jgi:hypothetical protein
MPPPGDRNQFDDRQGGDRIAGQPAAYRPGLGRGLRLDIDPNAPLSLYLGLFEWEIAGRIRALCRPGTKSFDVGAYNGSYGIAFSRLSGSRVICFDARPGRVRTCGRNMQVER